jgi:hypothetical protein
MFLVCFWTVCFVAFVWWNSTVIGWLFAFVRLSVGLVGSRCFFVFLDDSFDSVFECLCLFWKLGCITFNRFVDGCQGVFGLGFLDFGNDSGFSVPFVDSFLLGIEVNYRNGLDVSEHEFEGIVSGLLVKRGECIIVGWLVFAKEDVFACTSVEIKVSKEFQVEATD